MRKLLLLVAIVVSMVAIVNAQVAVSVSHGATYRFVEQDLTVTGATTTSTSTSTVDFSLQTDNEYKLDVGVNIDAVSGSPIDSIFVYGKKASDVDWSLIGKAACVTGTTTTSIFSHTTEVRYRFVRAYVKYYGKAVRKLDNVWLKLWID